MERKTMKENVWHTLKSYLCMQGSLVQDNGHSLVQVPRRSGSGTLWKRTVHKEFGIISRKRCCWNSMKVAVQFSVQQLHCPGANSRAKDTENCRFTIVPTRKQLRLIFRIIAFANHLSLYGAVENMCD